MLKSQTLLFFLRHKKVSVNINLAIGNKSMKPESCVKYLRLNLDSNLCWKYHVNTVAEKISKNIRALSKLRHFCSSKILTMLYYSLIHPFLTYCLKPGFHIIVRVVPVAPVFSNYVQATGTIIWKHHRDDHERSKKTEKTGTTAIAWIEKFLSRRPKRSRQTVNILMETTFGRPGRPKISHNAPYYVPHCVPKMAGSTELFLNKERFME